MKILYISLLLCLHVYTAIAQDKHAPAVKSDWYENVSSYINNAEYGFHTVNEKDCFDAVNKANLLSFSISSSGYTVKPLKIIDKCQDWKVSFELMQEANGSATQTNGHLVFTTPAIDVEYIHSSKGLRQNFIVKDKPCNNKSLAIHMQLSTALRAAVINRNKLIFYDEATPNQIKFSYEDLSVWDATGQSLPATMKLNAATQQLSIEVDDAGAVYPVTIDPLNKAPEWTGTANGIVPSILSELQVQALYGYAVAGLGDINNDGYDDIAVSAPGMADIISGTGELASVGAVYIYLGSASGLSNIPSKVLQPTTPIAGALFGFSIDAGDVTGDGIPDIIIGAPGDSYQTQASALLGATVNVNVTAGKVYLFRSEDLFTAANPSAFVELRLQGTGFFNSGLLGLLENISVNALFGYSVAVTEDLNGDGKKDIAIGSPAYLGKAALSVQSGAAFIYYSDDLTTVAPVRLAVPTSSLLGLPTLPLLNLGGLLFGFSIDGAGDYNNDGNQDVVVGAPAGVDLSSLGGIFSGQVLGGSAYVYYGTGTGVNASIGASLIASPTGLLSNLANLFGYKVKGVRNAYGTRNGNILVSAPAGNVLSNVVGGLEIKAGQVHVFPKKTSAFTSPVTSTQALSSPRSSSILSVLAGRTINASLLFGAGLDNILDVNCDTYGDIIVGEPLSTAIAVVGTDVVGGSAYIYKGKANGTYEPTPAWSVFAEVSSLIGVNASALIGYSVAGAGHTQGASAKVRVIVGGPSNTLDFGAGILNLGNTLNTLTGFVFDNNGLGKTYTYMADLCNLTTLPVTLTRFSGYAIDKTVQLEWNSVNEENINYYELQRSTNGNTFDPLAVVFAKNTIRNDYNFIDRDPAAGLNFYRLKIVSKDAKTIYANVISIRFMEKNNSFITVSPNPVSNEFRIQLKGIRNGAYTLKLQNVAGQTVHTTPVAISQTSATVTLPSPKNIKDGIYWLSLYNITGEKAGTAKVMILK